MTTNYYSAIAKKANAFRETLTSKAAKQALGAWGNCFAIAYYTKNGMQRTEFVAASWSQALFQKFLVDVFAPLCTDGDFMVLSPNGMTNLQCTGDLSLSRFMATMSRCITDFGGKVPLVITPYGGHAIVATIDILDFTLTIAGQDADVMQTYFSNPEDSMDNLDHSTQSLFTGAVKGVMREDFGADVAVNGCSLSPAPAASMFDWHATSPLAFSAPIRHVKGFLSPLSTPEGIVIDQAAYAQLLKKVNGTFRDIAEVFCSSGCRIPDNSAEAQALIKSRTTRCPLEAYAKHHLPLGNSSVLVFDDVRVVVSYTDINACIQVVSTCGQLLMRRIRPSIGWKNELVSFLQDINQLPRD